MRKKLSIAALLLLIAVSWTRADIGQTITVNGQTIQGIVNRITFEGDNVVLHFAGDNTETADMDAVVLSFDYSSMVSVEELSVLPYSSSTSVTIYDAQGKLIATTSRLMPLSSCLSTLRSGVYVLKSDQQTMKISTSALHIPPSTIHHTPSTLITRAAGTDDSVPRNTSVSQALLTLTDGTNRYYDTQSLEAIDIDGQTGRITLTTTSQQQDVFNATLATLAFAKAATNEGIIITEAKGWLESAYVKFNLYEGATTYNVYVKGGQYADFTRIDNELVRNYGTYGRADVVGLKAGSYILKVVPVVDNDELTDKAAVTEVLTVKNYDRTGYAHFNYSGVGAYNDDGTLTQGAKVFYVTKTTAKTISTDVVGAKQNPCVGIQTIIDAYQKGKDTTPIAFRFIGLVEKDDLDAISSSEQGLQLKGKKSDSELNITIEGIGDDATLRGFGFLVRNAKSVEFRNLAIMRCMDDGISLDTDNSYIWIHNMDFFYGKHGSGDHTKGDGACDAKSDTKYSTFSYCHYWDTGKTNMFGMKSESGPNYLSYHHNWFDHSDSRHPRVRTMTVHVYNNFFDNVAKYGVGATYGASVFVENNYFLKTKKPILSSKQGTDALGSGTFSGENGGMIKAYGNYFDRTAEHFSYYTQNNPSAKGYDAYETATRDEQVPETEQTLAGGTTYNNFDTNSELIYTYTPDTAEDVPVIVTGYYGAGRMNHGDFQYTFPDNTGNDDTDSAYDTVLGNMIDSYKSAFIGIFGE